MPTILVNGDEREIPADFRVSQLLDELKLERSQVAVELNAEVLPRAHYAQTELKAQDRLEIVTFVGGG